MCHLPGNINHRRRDTVIVGHTSTERTFPLVAVRPRAGAEAIVLNVCLWHLADINAEAEDVRFGRTSPQRLDALLSIVLDAVDDTTDRIGFHEGGILSSALSSCTSVAGPSHRS
jgi:hypothetical protein